MTLDHPVRSGLCHGPSCEQKITEKSPSSDFHDLTCQARWQASLVDAKPFGCDDLCELPAGHFGYCAWISAPDESVEALRPLDLSLGARHHLTGGEYVVTESEPGRAVLRWTWLGYSRFRSAC
jgi:hypothetical protein